MERQKMGIREHYKGGKGYVLQRTANMPSRNLAGDGALSGAQAVPYTD
jgi:hypothetical protein